MRIYAFALLFLLPGCVSDKKKTPQLVSGIFTTYRPEYIERYFIEYRYKARVYPLPAVMMYLRPNGTYVFGFCDNQISQAGKYEVVDDAILLYDKYILDDRLNTRFTYVYYEKDDDLLCIVTPRQNLDGKKWIRVIPLKRNHKHAHAGFLRGQEMDLDSIVHHYQQRPVEEQNRWTDSVRRSLRRVNL